MGDIHFLLSTVGKYYYLTNALLMDRKGVKVFASTNNNDMNIHTHMCIYLYIRKNFRSGVANSEGPRMVHVLIDTIKLPFKWLHQFILPLKMYQMAYSSHP